MCLVKDKPACVLVLRERSPLQPFMANQPIILSVYLPVKRNGFKRE